MQFLFDILAARMAERRIILRECSRCKRASLTDLRAGGEFFKTCDKCRASAAARRRRDKTTPQQRKDMLAARRKWLLESDPVLSKMREGFQEYVPVSAKVLKLAHSPAVARMVCRTAARARNRKERDTPWGE